jgi:hypothetical protein
VDDCCLYWILQVHKNGQWIDTTINSKLESEVKAKTIGVKKGTYRIIQRSIKDDKALGKPVPKCC